MRSAVIEPGDRVLVRNVGLKSPQKLANRWEDHPYIVKEQAITGISVFEVQNDGAPGKTRTLHRNMLLPINTLPILEDQILAIRTAIKPLSKGDNGTENTGSSSDISEESSSEEDSDPRHESREQMRQTYVIPQHREAASFTRERPLWRKLKQRKTQKPSRRRKRPRKVSSR